LNKKVTPEMAREFVNLYTAHNMSADLIGGKFGVSKPTVLTHLRLQGVTIRKLREAALSNRCNEEFFEDIRSNDQAQILGLLLADGCVSKFGSRTASLILSLQALDLDYLQAIMSKMGCNFQPSLVKLKKKHPTWQDQYRLCISSAQLCSDLYRLGCHPNKSLTLIPPKIDDKFVSALILGYFEGDGSVHADKEGQLHVSFVGTKEMCEFIKTTLKQNIDVNCNMYQERNKLANCFAVRFGGNRQARRFFQWAYADKSFFMRRKHDKFTTIFNQLDSKANEQHSHLVAA
jgi:hypothetical protein